MRLFPELPLLKRELTELANRKRTYIVRFLGALIILFFVFLMYEQSMAMRLNASFGFNPVQAGLNPMLGVGGEIFARATPSLFIAVQLLMPALCCASIAHEKESNTLGTLLLTRLSPGTIVLEKFLSRVVPMLTLLLVSFPVLAYVFSLGGVDTIILCSTIWFLLLECLLFGSFALLCSAWFPTTLSAFTAAYVGTAVLAVLTLAMDVAVYTPFGMWITLNRDIMDFFQWNAARLVSMAGQSTWQQFSQVAFGLLEKSLPTLLVSTVFFLLTRFLLVRRAFTGQSSTLLKLFKVVDRFFQWLNQRTTGGVEIVRDTGSYPIDDPIAWRERSKKSLGKARYLFRILIALEFPTLFICSVSAIESARSEFVGLRILLGILWALACLIIIIKASTLLTSERARQTLESLLACPLTAREILNQKIAGTNRLMIVMAVPVLTVHITLFLVLANRTIDSLLYLLLATVNTFLLLKIIIWLSAGIGLHFTSQMKAVVAASAAVLFWTVGPLLLFIVGNVFLEIQLSYLALMSPVAAVVANEFSLGMNSVSPGSGLLLAASYFPMTAVAGILTFLHLILYMGIKHVLIRQLPQLLNRRESSVPELPFPDKALEGATV